LNENVSVDVQDLVAEGKVSSTVVRNLSKQVKDPAELTKQSSDWLKLHKKLLNQARKHPQK